MRKVIRADIVDRRAYDTQRGAIREKMIRMKGGRRIGVGPYFTFLFENRETMIYQIQEMTRAEGIDDERAIDHEIETYNALVPGPDELTATLLIEIDDPLVRRVKLAELVGLEKHVFLAIDGRIQIPAQFDQAQLDVEKVSAVQYLRFGLSAHREVFMNAEHVAIRISHPCAAYERELDQGVLKALREDLCS